MSSALSPQQAADRAKTSRWTVSRALLSGDLEGVRNNRGHWKIDPDKLDAWAALHVRTEAPTEQQSEQRTDAAQSLAIENAGLKVEVKQLNERLDEARADRAKLLDMITDLSKPAPSFGARILGSR